MAANCPQQMASSTRQLTDELGHPLTPDHDGVGTAVLDMVGQLLCGMQGHEHVMQHSEGRLFLRCMSCGHESPGWDVPTRVRAAKVTEPRRHIDVMRPTQRVA